MFHISHTTCVFHLASQGWDAYQGSVCLSCNEAPRRACSCKSCCLGRAGGSVWRVLRVWSRANGSLEPREKEMAGACSCKSCCLGKAGGSVWRVWSRANGRLEPPEEQMTGACSCKSCCLGKAGEGVWRVLRVRSRANGSLEPREKQMAGACSCKSCCLGKACGSVWSAWSRANGSLEPREKQMAGAFSCKSCCIGKACGRLWRVWSRANGSLEPPEKQMAGAVRVVALERPAAEAGQTAVLPWKGLRKRLEGLKPGKRQSWTPVKNRWQGHVAVRVVALETRCGVWRVLKVWSRANGSLELPEKQMAKACSCKSGRRIKKK